jgi:hypothetical protein
MLLRAGLDLISSESLPDGEQLLDEAHGWSSRSGRPRPWHAASVRWLRPSCSRRTSPPRRSCTSRRTASTASSAARRRRTVERSATHHGPAMAPLKRAVRVFTHGAACRRAKRAWACSGPQERCRTNRVDEGRRPELFRKAAEH